MLLVSGPPNTQPCWALRGARFRMMDVARIAGRSFRHFDNHEICSVSTVGRRVYEHALYALIEADECNTVGVMPHRKRRPSDIGMIT